VSDETVDRLVQEVSDLLDVSSVGLYEFLELQKDPDVARRALDRLLSDQSVGLYEMRWPNSGHVRRLHDLPSDPWRTPAPDGTYFAIDRESGAPDAGNAAS